MISVDKSTNILKEKLRNWSFSFLGLATLILITSCNSNEANNSSSFRYEIMGEAQGTTYNIVYYSDNARIQKNQVDSILDEVDLAGSVWVPHSVISQVNKASLSKFVIPTQSNTYFEDNFKLCKEVYVNTNGAFNPTVGALVNAWGFGFKNRENMDSTKVDSLLQTVGFSDLDFNLVKTDTGLIILKSNPLTNLDYNGIAQGYSVDVLGEYFKEKGVSNFMIEVGGELLANGHKPNGDFWKIGIDEPLSENLGRKLKATIKLDGLAVATSGNYRKFYEKDGVRYAHTLNPETGFPVQHSLLSVTVVMSNCGLADAYATSFMVMGMEKAQNLIESKPELGIEAYFIYSNNKSNLTTYYTSGLKKIIKEL